MYGQAFWPTEERTRISLCLYTSFRNVSFCSFHLSENDKRVLELAIFSLVSDVIFHSLISLVYMHFRCKICWKRVKHLKMASSVYYGRNVVHWYFKWYSFPKITPWVSSNTHGHSIIFGRNLIEIWCKTSQTRKFSQFSRVFWPVLFITEIRGVESTLERSDKMASRVWPIRLNGWDV